MNAKKKEQQVSPGISYYSLPDIWLEFASQLHWTTLLDLELRICFFTSLNDFALSGALSIILFLSLTAALQYTMPLSLHSHFLHYLFDLDSYLRLQVPSVCQTSQIWLCYILGKGIQTILWVESVKTVDGHNMFQAFTDGVLIHTRHLYKIELSLAACLSFWLFLKSYFMRLMMSSNMHLTKVQVNDEQVLRFDLSPEYQNSNHPRHL